MVPTELVGATKVRDTAVTFVDGVRWSIVTGPPDEPPTPRTVLGRTRPGRHGVGDRVATVRDEHERVLAVATWPDRKTQRAKMVESMGDREAWAESTGAVVSAGKATAREIRRRRPHRQGRFKWLILAVVSFFFAFGSLPIPIVGLATGEVGLAIGFGVVLVVSLVIGFWSLRRWRDVSTCWSCGQPITGKPTNCSYCDAAKPRSAGFAPRMLATPTSRSFGQTVATGLIQRVSFPVFRSVAEAPQVRFADETHWLLPVEIPDRFIYGARLGEILTISSTVKTTTLTPNGAVPIEAALLCWHIVEGDIYSPPDVGGGG